MKVIKNGSDKNFQIYCHKCKSDIQYQLFDIQEINEKKYDYDGKQYDEIVDRIICPVCKEKLSPTYREVECENE